MSLAQGLILLISIASCVLSYLNLRATQKLAALYAARNPPITTTFDFGEQKDPSHAE